MDLLELIQSRRTIRRYRQQKIDQAVLTGLIQCARMAPSAANRQPLEYFIVQREELLEPVFQTLRWAGYIAPEGTPHDGEKPAAYIVVLIKREIETPSAKYDAGAAIENMLLAAWSQGIGSCWIGSVNRGELARILGIPDEYTIDSVIALGYPAEKSVAEEAGDSIKYYKDADQVLHVPKRPLENILHIDSWK